MSTCLGLELSKTDALGWTYFGDPGPNYRTDINPGTGLGVTSHTRECLAPEVGRQFRGAAVATMLSAVIAERGAPRVIQCDQGTEFTSIALDQWAYWNKVQLDFSRRGTPSDNAVCEAFNGSVRRECLSQAYFLNYVDARQALKKWKDDYNNVRPHSSLHDLSPAQCRARELTPETVSECSKQLA